jgi:hypothetical protein
MAERVVDLSEKPRAVVTLQLGGRSFRIARVVMGVRRLYGEFIADTGRLLEQTAEVARKEQELAAGGPPALQAEISARATEIEEAAGRRHGDLMAMVAKLLEENGYEFDRAWWEDHADPTDVIEFIREALNKDSGAEKKTAVPGSASTSSVSGSSSAASGPT